MLSLGAVKMIASTTNKSLNRPTLTNYTSPTNSFRCCLPLMLLLSSLNIYIYLFIYVSWTWENCTVNLILSLIPIYLLSIVPSRGGTWLGICTSLTQFRLNTNIRLILGQLIYYDDDIVGPNKCNCCCFRSGRSCELPLTDVHQIVVVQQTVTCKSSSSNSSISSGGTLHGGGHTSTQFIYNDVTVLNVVNADTEFKNIVNFMDIIFAPFYVVLGCHNSKTCCYIAAINIEGKIIRLSRREYLRCNIMCLLPIAEEGNVWLKTWRGKTHVEAALNTTLGTPVTNILPGTHIETKVDTILSELQLPE
tara:strand:- start:694 stop:1611 length:918 start_codon:yes stop_codon:yes gene_type:complete